jgi:hypothetical protein
MLFLQVNGWDSTGRIKRTRFVALAWTTHYVSDLPTTQLFARRGEIPQTSPPSPPSTWTVFEMPLREPGPIPPAFDFTRFLASSITFMAYLSEVSVYLDDKCLSRLKKSSGVTKSLPIPPGLIGTSRSRMMNVTGIRSTRTLRFPSRPARV